MEKKNRIFFEFLKKHLDSRISMYADHKPVGGHIVTVIGQLTDRSARHADGECGIFYQDEDSGEARGADVTERLMAWIHENVWKRGGNVTRADAAEYVSMNQEYMSRMFKEKTGISFKDYVLQEKMKYAEKLLRETAMPRQKWAFPIFPTSRRCLSDSTGMRPPITGRKCLNQSHKNGRKHHIWGSMPLF